MKITTECIPCFVKQAFEAAQSAGLDAEATEAMVKKTLRHIAEIDWKQSPPLMGRDIQNMLKQATGLKDPYATRKKQQIDTALALLPEMEKRVATADDPFVEAVRFSIAGNAIDLGALSTVSADANVAFHTALTHPLPMAEIAHLKADIEKAQRVLFLTDNCGEVIFDRPLMNLIGASRLTVGMRGMPVINDATIADADLCGFPDDYLIISNGSDIPGTWLPECDATFADVFHAADVVIAKGQGNYETLSDAKRSIYFLLLVKCPAIARDTGCEPGTYFIKRAGMQ